MATYQWLGGYTGSTGANSGYTGGIWTNPDGLTSAIGDYFFSPYTWGMTQNWLQVISTKKSSTYKRYVPTSILPKGGDTVIFAGGYYQFGGTANGATATWVNTGSLSCLYGGMSGDGYTASGSTAWAGGWTASGDMHGNITFIIEETYLTQASPEWNTGSLGYGLYDFGLPFEQAPLKIRTNSVLYKDASRGFGISGAEPATIHLHNISTSTDCDFSMQSWENSLYPSDEYWNNYGIVHLQGSWETITQDGGYMFLDHVTTPGDSDWSAYNIGGSCRRFSSSNDVAIKNFYVNPQNLFDDGYIWGTVGTNCRSIAIGDGWTGPGKFTIGDLGGSTAPSIDDISLSRLNYNPNIYLASCTIEKLRVFNGHVAVSSDCDVFGYPIVRDGFIRGGTLDMRHPTLPNWQQFLLGYAPGDAGLRIDDPAAGFIIGYPGVSFKTGSAEPPFGAT